MYDYILFDSKFVLNKTTDYIRFNKAENDDHVFNLLTPRRTLVAPFTEISILF